MQAHLLAVHILEHGLGGKDEVGRLLEWERLLVAQDRLRQAVR